jgi:1-acyl-sn-glycerol-3-phosphate acyltransferase
MMSRFVELHEEAFGLGLDLIVFPQGTRSVRLSKGHIGLAEVALAYEKTIVPVGCNNCDRIYPGGSPVAKGGTVTYRFGQPIRYDEMKPFHIAEDFTPFTKDAEHAHRERFQGLVDLVMDRINDLLDPRHQRDETGESGGVIGSSRFV